MTVSVYSRTFDASLTSAETVMFDDDEQAAI
jgi:hypothetical protein